MNIFHIMKSRVSVDIQHSSFVRLLLITEYSNCFPDIICSYYHSIFSKFGLIIPLRELKNSNDFIAYRVSRIFVLHIIVIDQGSVGWMVKVSVTEK
jgi:hypothetical protein